MKRREFVAGLLVGQFTPYREYFEAGGLIAYAGDPVQL